MRSREDSWGWWDGSGKTPREELEIGSCEDWSGPRVEPGPRGVGNDTIPCERMEVLCSLEPCELRHELRGEDGTGENLLNGMDRWDGEQEGCF